jgi:ferrochelatase
MRYGNPTMEAAYDNLIKRIPGIEEVEARPMYPHYAMSSTKLRLHMPEK